MANENDSSFFEGLLILNIVYEKVKIFEIIESEKRRGKVFSLMLIHQIKFYSPICNSKTSLRKPERFQRRIWGGIFNRSHQRRFRDLEINSVLDVSETRHGTSQRCMGDAFMPAFLTFSWKFGSSQVAALYINELRDHSELFLFLSII